jgi:RHS repeat-associated protein
MKRTFFIVLTLIALASMAQAQEVVEYYHTDALGSVRAVTGQSGAVIARHDYLPFGEEYVPQTGSDSRRFTGKERDTETGLDYFGARYYASGNGRFTTVDPGHVGGDIFNPQSWNGYAYALNNPLRFVDPLGMEPCQITLRGADATAAGVADGGTVEGECVRGKKDSWLSRQFFGFLDLMTWTAAVQAPGVGEADLPLPDRSPDTAVLAAAAIMGAPRGVAGRITGRLTQEGLEHIVLRHWATSGAQGCWQIPRRNYGPQPKRIDQPNA